MSVNHDGGFTFVVTWITTWLRFLILGSPTCFYASAKDNWDEIRKFIQEQLSAGHGLAMVAMAEDVFVKGRAAKQDPFLIALAVLCRADQVEVRGAAFAVVPKLRTLSQLLSFQSFYTRAGDSKGQGKLWKSAILGFFKSFLKKEDSGKALAFQVWKYNSRGDWSVVDLIFCTHIKASEYPLDVQFVLKVVAAMRKNKTADAFQSAFAWAAEKGLNDSHSEFMDYMRVIHWLKTLEAPTESDIVKVCEQILEHQLPREFLPTETLKYTRVWESMLPNMPMTALVRTLNLVTAKGLLGEDGVGSSTVSSRSYGSSSPGFKQTFKAEDSDNLRLVLEKLRNVDAIVRSHIHPATIFVAHVQYLKGQGMRGGKTWNPCSQVADALEVAGIAAFKGIPSYDAPTMWCIDVSGSMNLPTEAMPNMSSTEAVSLLVKIILMGATDPADQKVVGFSSSRRGGFNYYNHSSRSSLSSFKNADDIMGNGLETIKFNPMASVTEAVVKTTTSFSATDPGLVFQWYMLTWKEAMDGLDRPSMSQKKARYQELRKTGDVDGLMAIYRSIGWVPYLNFVVLTDNEVNTGNQPSALLKKARTLTGLPLRMAVVATRSAPSCGSIADPKDAGMMDFVGWDAALPQQLVAFLQGEI
jgi:60 kDa SS-A/Ro ribonucleoprotein